MTSIKNEFLVKSIDSFLCNEWLLKKHYLKRKTSFSYSFGLYKDKILVGVLTFGNAIPLTMKKSLFGENYMDLVYELNRLCTNDDLDKNAKLSDGEVMKISPPPPAAPKPKAKPKAKPAPPKKGKK